MLVIYQKNIEKRLDKCITLPYTCICKGQQQLLQTGASMAYTPRMGIVKKSGWAKGLIVREINESYSFTGLDEKGVTICTIMNENHQMTGGIVAVRDSEVTWGK